MLNFTAIDFETANFQRASVCQIGVAKVTDGQIVLNDAWLVRPPQGHRFFTNTFVHGITEEDVIDAPEWPASLARLIEVIEDHALVAYSPFDKGVWNAVHQTTGTAAPETVRFLDVLPLVRLDASLDDYKLPTAAKHYQLDNFQHHEAGADARAAAQIALKIAASKGAQTVDELWHEVLNRPKRTYNRFAYKASELPEANLDADPNHPLYGEVICFSGDLDEYTRAQAQRLVADLGATASAGVTRKTTLVVMGGFDPATLRPGATFSSKVQKAMDLKAKGQPIEIIPEGAFLDLLEQ